MTHKPHIDLPFAHRPHVLIVDDDAGIRDLLFRYLSQKGFVAVEAANADEADAMMAAFAFDIMVVDVMMPGRTGFEFVTSLRETSDTPALFLSAMGESADRMKGFEAGADDYLVKPFEPQELLYRLQAILRRVPQTHTHALSSLSMGALTYDFKTGALRHANGEMIVLTEGDAALLEALARSKGETVNRFALAELCGVDPDGRTIDVQVTRLRRKIETDTRHPQYLKTVRGVGYALRGDYHD